MLIAVNHEGRYVSADQAVGSLFTCPVCQKPVILKKGQYKIAHFSHQRVIDCYQSIYKQESAAHLAGKHELYRLSQQHHVSMECYIHEIEQIPDILVDHKSALELQLSVIPVETIMARTYGYHSLGISVVWIASETSLKKVDGQLKLTLFQRSMIDASRRLLVTFDADTTQFYCYEIIGLTDRLTLCYRRTCVKSVDDILCMRTVSPVTQAVKISKAERTKYISSCLGKKSVLEPTLSALYQLGIHWRHLPKEIGIVVPSQFYIRTHPIQWQSNLRLLLNKGRFSLPRFADELEFYTYYTNGLTHHTIALQLINEYRSAVRNLYVQI